MKLKILVIYTLGGLLAGSINGLLGGGGGMIIVPLLILGSLNNKQAQATSLVVILTISIVSAVIYIMKGNLELIQTLIITISVVIGGIIGSIILPHFKNQWLGIIFGLIMISAGFVSII